MGEFKIGMFGYFEFTVIAKKPRYKNFKEIPNPISGYFKVIDQDKYYILLQEQEIEIPVAKSRITAFIPAEEPVMSTK